MSMRQFLILLTIPLLFASAASATTLFDGWFEVFVGAKKIGFLAERYEFENKKFKCTYYLKTENEGQGVTEMLKAFANADLTPANYVHTTISGKDNVTIYNVKFKGQTATATVTKNGKTTESTPKKFQKGTFLSTFLLYLILQDKHGGLKIGNNYKYSAIAEEEATAYNGEALVAANDKVKGREAFKILNKYKIGAQDKDGSSLEEKFFTWVSPKGEILLTRSPDKNIDVRFADNQAEAIKGFMADLDEMRLLFGKKLPGEGKAGGETATDGKDDDSAASATPEAASGKVKVKAKAKPAKKTSSSKSVPIGGLKPPAVESQGESHNEPQSETHEVLPPHSTPTQ